MFHPLALFIGLRYTRAKRRNQFISFVSLISLLGMILGVFALVLVLSIMNGFEAELRNRILSVIPHGFINSEKGALNNWQDWQEQLNRDSSVIAAAPYISSHVMLSRQAIMKPAKLTAIDPELEKAVSNVGGSIVAGNYGDLSSVRYGLVIGDILARSLGVQVGDSVQLTLPKVTVTPVGVFPRIKKFRIVAIFSVGAQLDADSIFIHLDDGQRLFQYGSAVKGLRVELVDMMTADSQLKRLAKQLSNDAVSLSWKDTQGSLFQAMKMEKTMITLLLMIIVTIAAFNIISILTMMVADKRSDIAVLRTMGMSGSGVRNVFMVQGMLIGLAGIFLGLLFGLPVALYIGDIIHWLESLLHFAVFNPDVYFISKIPSVVKWQDIALIAIAGFVLSVTATIFPAIRAAKVEPAEALRYE